MLSRQIVRVGFRSASILTLRPAVHSRLISSTNQKKTIAASQSQSAPPPNSPQTPSSYLDTLTTSELLGYGIIGLATISKPILGLVIKVFPYTPIWLIKACVSNYCGGDDLKQVFKTGERLAERGINNMMLSLTVEACSGNKISMSIDEIVSETQRSVDEMLVPHTVNRIRSVSAEKINEIAPGYVALKPTGLVDDAATVLLNYENPAYSEQYNILLTNCKNICQSVHDANKALHAEHPGRIAPFVVAVIDAERNDLQQGVYKLQRDLFEIFNKEEVSVVGTIQMYLKESTPLLLQENQWAKEKGYKLGWKLVRGAYIHSEPDRNVIHNTKEDTDVNYDSGIQTTILNLASSQPTVGHLVVASHNFESQLKVTQLLQKINNEKVSSNVVLGQLLGMADNITFDLMSKYNVKNIIKYVPWGPPLETKEYLLRRLEENGDAVRADSGWPLLKGVLQTLFKRVF